MLNITTNPGYKKSNINFGTNLVIGQGVVDHLNKHPEELKKIQDFKKYLAEDGKNWNAELTYDKFEQKEISLDETEKLIRAYAEDYNYDARQQAGENISQIKDSKIAVDFIEKLTKDPDRDVRDTAARMACSIKDSSIAAALIEKLVKSDDLYVRNSAADVAGEIQDPKIAIELIEKLTQNSDPEVRFNAAASLQNVKNASMRDAAIEKLSNSQDISIKKGIAMSLSKVEDKKLFDKLLEKLSADTNPEVKNFAISQLLDLDEEQIQANPKLYDNVIENAFNDSSVKDKYAVMGLIGKLSDSKKATDLINRAIKSDNSRWSRASAARSAGYIKDQQVAKETVQKLLEYPDVEIQRGAAEAISNIKDEKIKEELIIKSINHSEPDVRREIAFQISIIEDSQKQADLISKLSKDNDGDIRRIAVRNIGDIKNTNIAESLLKTYINSPDINIKEGLIEALDDFSNENPGKAKEFAQILAKDEDKYIQKEANNILNKIKRDSQKDHYNLKITDNGKVLGQKQVNEKKYDDKNIFDSLFTAYKAIFEKAI